MPRRFRVTLGETDVGQLIESQDGIVEFRFLPSYVELSDRPVLGQHFEDDLTHPYRGKRQAPLPAYFANLLPEGRLRAFVEENSGLAPRDDLGLLGALGEDLPGAVIVRPTDEDDRAGEGGAVDGGEGGEEDRFRFSLAGVQLKFSVVRAGDKLTMPARGAEGHFIVKVHGPELAGLAENEFSMMEWARAAGHSVARAELVPLTDLVGIPLTSVDPASRAFVVERYDRTSAGRVHQEDFAQVAGLLPHLKYDHLKYETLGTLVAAIAGPPAIEEFVRRLAFVVASGNADAHAKNWSLVYPDKVHAQLAPLYDQVFTGAYPTIIGVAGGGTTAQKPELALNLASVKQFARVDRECFRRLGERMHETDPRRIETIAVDAIANLRTTWGRIQQDLPLHPPHRELLREFWQAVPLLRDVGPLP